MYTKNPHFQKAEANGIKQRSWCCNIFLRAKIGQIHKQEQKGQKVEMVMQNEEKDV